ncbi:hypothetical protein V2S66_24755 [Streptomyces sp. V4-01]|uniref:Uncharacterized protein n=1 Tax=Actinacidiphila polyblastidii TaxID=3110430 RepID=A0ABU7PH82_9ACTN|nr:hypothetical protein [Streptomyces sp. V4-01]
MTSCVRFWRWRRNPLRRGTDRAEAAAVAVAGVLALLGAPAAGVATGLGVAGSAERAVPGLHQVAAVVVHRTPAPTAVFGVDNNGQRVSAQVRWSTPDGAAHTGQALVKPGLAAGAHTSVWLDARGALRPNPPDSSQAQVRAVIYGTAAATATGGAVGCGWLFARSGFDRRRAARLDREWALVGPVWRRHRA